MNGESQVLFLDGPLAGQWLDYAKVGMQYTYVECKYPDISIMSGRDDVLLEPIVEDVYHSYTVTKITIFGYWMLVAHCGDKASLKRSLLEHLVPPGVREKLQTPPD